MLLKCKIGLHSWNGCKCSDCDKTRDKQHDWSKDCEICTKCGLHRIEAHKWHGCKCTVCSKTRNEHHFLSNDCTKCTMCGKTIDNKHEWDGCKCLKCRQIRNEHNWIGCKCSKCGKIRDEEHNFSKDCEKCSICGKTKVNAHQWDGCICILCKKTQNREHTFNESGTLCIKCGKFKPIDNTPINELYECLKGSDGEEAAMASEKLVTKKGTEAIYMIFNALNLGILGSRPVNDADLRVCIAGCAVAISRIGSPAIPILKRNATLDFTKFENGIKIAISIGALQQIGGRDAELALNLFKEMQEMAIRRYRI
jgi:hypothetical protein